MRFASTKIASTVRVASLLSSALLAACVVTADQSIESNPNDPRAQDVTDKIRSIDLLPRQAQNAPDGGLRRTSESRPAIYLGDGRAPEGGAVAERDDNGGSGYDLNFENAPVATVAKVILGDVLGVGYTIDPRVQGTVTLASVRPVPKTDALYVLENALRMSNVALVRERAGSYRLVPSQEAGAGSLDRNGRAEAGQGISVITLRYASAQNVLKLIDSFGVRPGTVRADGSRNTLIIAGSGTERQTAIDTILSFDADWIRGQSVGIFPVRNSTPEPIIAEIEKIMDSGEGGMGQNVVKFQPIARMNSIMVVSQKPDQLKRASTWIARLDRADTEGTNLKSYPLRFANARQVTSLLNEMLTGATASGSSFDNASSQISPGGGIAVSSSGGGALGALSASPPASGGGGGSVAGFQGGAGAAPSRSGVSGSGQELAVSSGGSSTARAQATNALLPNVRITADVSNNAILVYANQESQRLVEQTLRQIDRPQRQIAIEATIAEVTLNDSLNYGVQFFLASKDVGLKPDTGSLLNTAGNAILARAVPGFNFLVGPDNAPRVVLDALHGVTDVKVLSNPSLVVLDNQPATLQVGDQVPFSTGTATVLTANNTIVNTIDYRNTGIILRVQPRANASGNVVLDIEQEISNIAAGSAQSLTPTISQRKVKSSIAVMSGQTVLLAGLISETENRGRQGIPVLDQLPGIGDAFGNTRKTRARTELILFIRPTVVKDPVDAHVIAEEMRSKMNSRLVGTSLPVIVTNPFAPVPR